MTKKSALISTIVAGTLLAAGAYALTRSGTRPTRARASERQLPPAAPTRLAREFERSEPPEPLVLDLADVFDGQQMPSEDEISPASVTVQVSERIPLPSSGDDAEAMAPEDLGRAWLSHATQSEHSLSQAELPDIENIAALEELDEEEVTSARYSEPSEDARDEPGEDAPDADRSV